MNTSAAFALCTLHALNIGGHRDPLLNLVRMAETRLSRTELDNSAKGIRRSIRAGYCRETAELRAAHSRRTVETPLRAALVILREYTSDTARVEAYDFERKEIVLTELREMGLSF